MDQLSCDDGSVIQMPAKENGLYGFFLTKDSNNVQGHMTRQELKALAEMILAKIEE